MLALIFLLDLGLDSADGACENYSKVLHLCFCCVYYLLLLANCEFHALIYDLEFVFHSDSNGPDSLYNLTSLYYELGLIYLN